MSTATIYSRARNGINAPEIKIEVHISNGLPAFQIVGLPDASVRESRDRVRSALVNSEFQFPQTRLTISLSPADIPKEGARFDLAIAVIVGVIISALVFAWKHASQMVIEVKEDNGTKVYLPKGPLFFGSIQHFRDHFNPREDADVVIIDFAECRVMDHSGLEAIDALADRYEKAGKELHIRHLSAECRRLLDRAGNLVEVNMLEDPNYKVADDRLA